MLVDHLEDCGIFSNFNYGFRSSQSTEDLLTAITDRIARIFDSSGNNRTVELDLSKALSGFSMLVYFTNLRLIEFWVIYLAFILSFVSNRRPRVARDG